MKFQIAIHRTTHMKSGSQPRLEDALRPVPTYARAVREVSKMFSNAGIRYALVGALGANAYRNRPRTTEDIDFLVGDEAFERQRRIGNRIWTGCSRTWTSVDDCARAPQPLKFAREANGSSRRPELPQFFTL